MDFTPEEIYGGLVRKYYPQLTISDIYEPNERYYKKLRKCIQFRFNKNTEQIQLLTKDFKNSKIELNSHTKSSPLFIVATNLEMKNTMNMKPTTEYDDIVETLLDGVKTREYKETTKGTRRATKRPPKGSRKAARGSPKCYKWLP